jgi:hypothetical protein
MKLDLLLFGRITSGPFFALLVKELPPEGGRHNTVKDMASREQRTASREPRTPSPE